MRLKYKKLIFVLLLSVVILAFPVNGYAKFKVGKLVDINSDGTKITIDEALDYPEKKHVSYTIADNAKWHICTKKACLLKKGAAGFTTFKKSVKSEAYGMPYRSFRVLLKVRGDKVKELEIQLTKKTH